MSAKVEGLDMVMRNLRSELNKRKDVTIQGLLAGGLIIQGEAQERVPVEYGHLRASAYTRKSPEDPNVVEVGFSASYALYVHENLDQRLKGVPRPSGLGVYWGPHGQPKFLENAVTAKFQDVMKAVAAYGKSR